MDTREIKAMQIAATTDSAGGPRRGSSPLRPAVGIAYRALAKRLGGRPYDAWPTTPMSNMCSCPDFEHAPATASTSSL